MDLSKLALSDKLVIACGAVLVIDLLALPWHSVSAFGVSVSFTAIEERNAFLGLLALLLAAAVTAVTAVRVFKPETELPELPVSWNQAIFFGSAGTAGLLVLKLLLETDFLGFGAYLGILLAGGMAYGGFLKSKEDEPATGATPPTA